MSATVRLFAYPGIHTLASVSGTAFNTANAQVFKNPYEASALITAADVAVSSGALEGGSITCALMQVQNGKRIHAEINRGNSDARVATTSSPIYEGNVTIEFGPGWSVSVLECTE